MVGMVRTELAEILNALVEIIIVLVASYRFIFQTFGDFLDLIIIMRTKLHILPIKLILHRMLLNKIRSKILPLPKMYAEKVSISNRSYTRSPLTRI